MFAKLVVNLPIDGVFHYAVPESMRDTLRIGHLVEVSFGRQKAQAVVIAFDPESPVNKNKPILDLIDNRPVLTPTQLRLAVWMSHTYLAPLADCVRLFIPTGMSKQGDVLVTALIDPALIQPHTDTQARLLKLLAKRGPLRGRQLERALPRRHWRKTVDDLVERGLARREPILAEPSVRKKEVRVVALRIEREQVEQIINTHLNPDTLPDTRHAAAGRRAGVLQMLRESPSPLKVGEIYAAIEGSTLADLRYLARSDWVSLRQEEVFRDPLADRIYVPDKAPPLTPHQTAAWKHIEVCLEASQPPKPVLLHGVTGSGKTEVYMKAVQHVIDQGRQAIVMVPEIALTSQTLRRFGARFGDRMALVHSRLSPGERFDTWRRARDGQYDLVIGPRSALFTPLPNLGLIVLDECHDDSYKQAPPIRPPYYHTLPTAVELASYSHGLVIAGSATPNVATMAQATPPDSEERYPFTLIELPARIMGHRDAIAAQAVHYRIQSNRYTHQDGDPDEAVMIDLPPVQLVDMRQELRGGNRSIFSRALSAAIGESLSREEQIILFLNRRGTATYVFCRSCGLALTCPRCETPLTWHTYRHDPSGEQGRLICHQCDFRQREYPHECPDCGSKQIKFFGGGTERVEQDLLRDFPQARPVRWDADTTSGKDSHDVILSQFITGEANVLIGTQMVAKGLDLPLVTLVGVISADTALYLPDYRSGERSFQLLTQVSGRAGRSLLGGRVIVQTYAPAHYAIAAAAEHDYHGFYTQELRYREEMNYPPYARLARLEIRATSQEQAREIAGNLHSLLTTRINQREIPRTALIGPVPCFYARQNDLHRWQIIVRGPNPAALLDDIQASSSLFIDIDPVSLL